MADRRAPNYGVIITGPAEIQNVIAGQFVRVNQYSDELNRQGRPELAEAITGLANDISANDALTSEAKESSLGTLAEIGEQTTKPMSDKSKLKELLDGLMATVKSIPDIAKAVVALYPLLGLLVP